MILRAAATAAGAGTWLAWKPRTYRNGAREVKQAGHGMSREPAVPRGAGRGNGPRIPDLP